MASERQCGVWARGSGCVEVRGHKGPHVSQCQSQLAAVTAERDALRAAGERLYGQAMTFAIQFHVQRGHDGLFDDGLCGIGACMSTLKQMAAWRAALAAASEGEG